MTRTLGILVAGGRGRRLGLGCPKALVAFRGESLLARQLATLAARCDEVLVAAPAGLALPVPAHSRVADPGDAEGPLAGLVAGLGARPFARAFVLAVDLPFVTPGAFDALAARLADAPAVVATDAHGPQPLMGVYAPAAVAPLTASLAAGERSLVAAVGALPPRLATPADLGQDPQLLFNVNTADDLARAEQWRPGAGAA